jgi:hypothetical protein
MMGLEPLDHALQQPNDLALGVSKLAPNAAQCRRGVVANCAVVLEGALDRVFLWLGGNEAVGEGRQHRSRERWTTLVAQGVARSARGAQQLSPSEQLGASPHDALDAQPCERRDEVRQRLGMPRLLTLNDRSNRGDARVLAFQLRSIGVRLQTHDQSSAQLRCSATGDEIEHTREFDDAKSVAVHGAGRREEYRDVNLIGLIQLGEESYQKIT